MMITIDIRLKEYEIDKLKSLVGKRIISIEHDSFKYVASSSQVVQINAETGTFFLYSFNEQLDHFGALEDVAVWTFETERYKVVNEKEFISTPLMETVKSVFVVQENQRLYKNGKQIYDVWLTRGLIFDFGTHQFSLEKAAWLSEDIYIQKGYELINTFSPAENFANSDWDEGITAECSREIINYK